MFIVKVPLNISNVKGCEKAPNEILKCLREIEVNELGKEINFDLFDIEEIHLDNNNLELSNELIYENSFEMFETKPKIIFIGGDCLVNYSTGKAFLNHCSIERKIPHLIIFDAHINCCSEKNLLCNNWLRKLIEGGFPSENILLVGARNFCREEVEFLKQNKIRQININSIVEDIDNIADTIMEFSNSGDSYISIDIDVIDSAFAPGTDNLEPAGLSSRGIIYLIQRINKIKNLRAVSLTGINLGKDENKKTIKLAAKIVGEIL